MTQSAHAELIPVTQSTINSFETLTVNARELHSFLGVHRDFSNWIKGRIKKYGFVEGVDFTSFAKIGEREIGATTRIEYILTVDMAKQLSMVENNAKGLQIRKYFIACERRALEAAAQAREAFHLTSEDAPRLEAKSTVADRAPLNGLITTWLRVSTGIGYHDAWHQIWARCGVAKTKDMTVGQVRESCAWVQSRIDSLTVPPAKALPVPEKAPQNIIDVVMKASHRNLDYMRTVSRLSLEVNRVLGELEKQMFEEWKRLDDCFMALVA